MTNGHYRVVRCHNDVRPQISIEISKPFEGRLATQFSPGSLRTNTAHRRAMSWFTLPISQYEFDNPVWDASLL
jgi:hypothetical protein